MNCIICAADEAEVTYTCKGCSAYMIMCHTCHDLLLKREGCLLCPNHYRNYKPIVLFSNGWYMLGPDVFSFLDTVDMAIVRSKCHFCGEISIGTKYCVSFNEGRCSERLWACEVHLKILEKYYVLYSCPKHRGPDSMVHDSRGWGYSSADVDWFVFETGMELG
jgi:hypothetical protein